jgi:hypothetical protein
VRPALTVVQLNSSRAKDKDFNNQTMRRRDERRYSQRDAGDTSVAQFFVKFCQVIPNFISFSKLILFSAHLFNVMKKLLFLSLILFSAVGLFAQQKPLTQGEYVKLLNDLQKNPSIKSDVIETVRKRGIDFPVTDGLLGLTKTKSGADAELARTLREAGRRKENPTAFQLPSAKESAEVLSKSREATLAAVEEMPDFVVKQIVQRGISYAGTNNFQNLDRLVVAVSYRSPDVSGASGAEEYRVLSLNGVLQETPKAKNNYFDVGGTSSTGEFVTVLSTIFKSENEAKFETVDTDVIRERRAIVYNFTVPVEKKPESISVGGRDSTVAGMNGKIWIDRENFRVLRVESNATDIPVDFQVRAAKRTIDYDWVTISNEKYLLPLLSDVRLTSRDGKNTYETRNVIRFKEYQKFGSEVKILDDDTEVPAEVKKP